MLYSLHIWYCIETYVSLIIQFPVFGTRADWLYLKVKGRRNLRLRDTLIMKENVSNMNIHVNKCCIHTMFS